MLVELLREGDLDGLVALYERDAVFADYAGAATGAASIRSVHQKFIDSGLELTLNDSVVFEADDIALVHWSWTVSHRDGSQAEGVSAEVLRRQADGTWRFLIDNSDGSALVGAL
jgi:ketosteroid isomerase-like protein